MHRKKKPDNRGMDYGQNKYQKISAQIEEAQDEHKKLEEKEEYMKTKKYVEEVARNQLGLVYPDEIVIRPKE